MSDVKYKPHCRLCKSKVLKLVLNLKDSPLCDAYLRKKVNQRSFPLKLFQCQNCYFVQINTVINPKIIYKDYIYTTTSSMGLKKHFQNYARSVHKKCNFPKRSTVLDIGSNDGTLLQSFKSIGYKILGIEPASDLAFTAEKKGVPTIAKFFGKKLAKEISKKYGLFDLITINNLFANIDNLSDFVDGLEIILSEQGIIVIESSYLYDMIKNSVFDFIYHEHLSYFAVNPLQKFFLKYNIQLIDIQKVHTKGGSLRYFWARKNSSHKTKNIVSLFAKTEKKHEGNKSLFPLFQKRIQKRKKELQTFIKQNKNSSFVGYGASATSTTLIFHFEIGKSLKFLVDDNPAKIGTFSPGLHLKVLSADKKNLQKASFIIILAWRYYKAILDKIKKLKIPCIVPLPTFRLIKPS